MLFIDFLSGSKTTCTSPDRKSDRLSFDSASLTNSSPLSLYWVIIIGPTLNNILEAIVYHPGKYSKILATIFLLLPTVLNSRVSHYVAAPTIFSLQTKLFNKDKLFKSKLLQVSNIKANVKKYGLKKAYFFYIVSYRNST